MSECFIDKLYGKYKGFSKFKGYIICACDGSIFDLPNTPTPKKHLIFLQTQYLKDF